MSVDSQTIDLLKAFLGPGSLDGAESAKRDFSQISDVYETVKQNMYVPESPLFSKKAVTQSAVIGKHWLTQNSASDGMSLGNIRDFVSIEIESARERHVPIIPVLVQGATMPREEDLPNKLSSFAFYNAIHVRPDPDFNQDCVRLIQGIEFHICGKAKKKIFAQIMVSPVKVSKSG